MFIYTIMSAIGALVLFGIVLSIALRRVVPTNMVNIVQSKKTTTSYGAGLDAGNVYWQWPSWVPVVGVSVIKLPVSNFDLSLTGYEAYDKDRVPFVVDVTAFFRISDTDKAAQRVTNITELHEQLNQIVQGAVRKVLASDIIDQIMLQRAKFGEQFTDEVGEQLREWGVEPVKSMELMDIRDGNDSNVIANIMAMKTSHIDMESRTEVAKNRKAAETAEIEAQQEIDIRAQEAEQRVGERTAEKTKAVGIADEQARQQVLTEERETKEKDMAVKKVEEVRQAEIEKEKQVVAAEQEKETTILVAEGDLAAEQRKAEGIQAVGDAEAAARKAMELAQVEPQITLAKEIGENDGYQDYLVRVELVAANKDVGIAQAAALEAADVKVIANQGDAVSGATTAMQLFTPQGGTQLAGMLEALSQTPAGQAALNKLGVKATDKPTPKASKPAVKKTSAAKPKPKAKAPTITVEAKPKPDPKSGS